MLEQATPVRDTAQTGVLNRAIRAAKPKAVFALSKNVKYDGNPGTSRSDSFF
jgi:hypothetical protein